MGTPSRIDRLIVNRLSVLIMTVATTTALLAAAVSAQHSHSRGTPARQPAAGGVYPQFRAPGGQVVHWLGEQMPLKIYVSPGTSLDSLIDPALGAPYTNVDSKEHWPDLVAGVVQNSAQLQALPKAEGFTQDQYQAALQGINSWKNVGGGVFSFQFTDDPGDADIYVFWTNKFVNKMGLALFENDIRGYTDTYSLKLSEVQQVVAQGKSPPFKPVVTLLRTTEGSGNPMPFGKMKASAAHEFGHALGIQGHSANPTDLMSVYYGHGAISPNDAATIRYLYHLTPDFIP